MPAGKILSVLKAAAAGGQNFIHYIYILYSVK